MNYNRKEWEKKHKRNPVARELEHSLFKPKFIPNGKRRERKIKPLDIINLDKRILNDEDI